MSDLEQKITTFKTQVAALASEQATPAIDSELGDAEAKQRITQLTREITNSSARPASC